MCLREGCLPGACDGCHAHRVRLTTLELLVILAAVLLVFTPIVVLMERRRGARLAAVWAPMGIAGAYLWFWSTLTRHARWLAVPGAALIVAGCAVQFAVRRSGGRRNGTTPS
jgi:hypothetical protein